VAITWTVDAGYLARLVREPAWEMSRAATVSPMRACKLGATSSIFDLRYSWEGGGGGRVRVERRGGRGEGGGERGRGEGVEFRAAVAVVVEEAVVMAVMAVTVVVVVMVAVGSSPAGRGDTPRDG
jgi:hypothetical protein